MTSLEDETRRPSIADQYQDLLAPLDSRYRLSLVRRLAQGFYEGWRPTRRELAALIAADTGRDANRGLSVSPSPMHGHQNATRGGSNTRSGPVPMTAATRAGSSQRSTQPGIRSIPNRPAAHSVVAAFNVDCGELVPRFQFVALSLSSAGMQQRGHQMCQLIHLNYELHPTSRLAGHPRSAGPVIFSAPILCIPDLSSPWASGDGKERQHTIGHNDITGRRGPWPITETAERVSFLIHEQSPAGIPPTDSPAGTLLVIMSTARAVWRPS